MKFKKRYIAWIIILFYVVFLGFNTSYHKLHSYDKEYKNNYGYWEIKYLGELPCNTRVVRIGDRAGGTTRDPEKKNGISCGLFGMSKVILEGPFFSGNIGAKPYYNVFCENTIEFYTLYCVSE